MVSRRVFLRRLKLSGAGVALPRRMTKSDLSTGERVAEWLIEHGQLTRWQARELLTSDESQFAFDGFTLLEPLGRGASGFVFRAIDGRGRHRVLKILHPAVASSPDALERFRRETRASMSVRHPNVLTAIQTGFARGLHYIAFEFHEGIDLRQLIHRCDRLPPEATARVVAQIARGLQHIADRGMVHRDVKPSNILVSPDGTARLLDLGLARLNQQSSESTVTETGQILGTVDYIAPEQAQDSRYADVRSDVYSLGCTMFHALSGRVPYPGETVAAKLIAHLTAEPRPLPQQVPAGLAGIVRRAMARDPGERFTTPGEMADAINAWTDQSDIPSAQFDFSVDATDESVSDEWQSFTLPFFDPPSPRLSPALVGIVATVVMLLTAGVVWLFRGEPTGTALIDLPAAHDVHAEILVDDAVVDSNQFDLSPGSHELLIRRPGYHDYRETFEVIAGITTTLVPRLVPTPELERQDELQTLTRQVRTFRSESPLSAVEFSNRVLTLAATQPTSDVSLQARGLLRRLPCYLDRFHHQDVSREEVAAFSESGDLHELIFVIGKSTDTETSDDGTTDFQRGEATDAACSVDGTTIVVTIAGEKMARCHIDRTPPVVEEIPVLRDPRSIAASPDSNVFVVGTTSAGCLFQARHTRELLVGHIDGRDHAAWSPDGLWLAFAWPREKINVFDAREFRRKGVFLEVPNTQWTDVTFSPDSQQIAASTPEGAVHIWDLATSEHRVLENKLGTPHATEIAWSPDGRQLAVMRGRDVALVDVETFAEMFWISVSVSEVNGRCSIDFRPDGRELLIAGDRGAVSTWDLTGARPTRSHRAIDLRKRINAVRYTPDGRHVLVASSDGTCAVLRLANQDGTDF